MYTVIETETGRWVVVCPQGHIRFGSTEQYTSLYWAAVSNQVPHRLCRLQGCTH